MTSTNARILVTALTLGLLLAGGCLPTGTYQPTRHFTLQPGGPAAKKGAVPIAATVKVRRFSVVPRYDSRMTRRVSGTQVRYEEYNRWVETPDELVANGFYRALLRSQAFRDVVPPEFNAPGDFLVEGRVMVFEVDPRSQARLSLVLVLRRESDNQVIWRETVNGTSPIEGADPAALAKAMSLALDWIVAGCIEEWRGLAELQGKK